MIGFGTFYFGTFDLEKFRISFSEVSFWVVQESDFKSPLWLSPITWVTWFFKIDFFRPNMEPRTRTKKQKFEPDRIRFEPGWTRTGVKIETLDQLEQKIRNRNKSVWSVQGSPSPNFSGVRGSTCLNPGFIFTG